MANHVSTESDSFEQSSLTTHTQHSSVPLRERFDFIDRLIPEWAYNATIAIVGEFLGTTFFLFFALAGTQVANAHLSPAATFLTGPAGSSTRTSSIVSIASLLYAALSVGFSLAVNAWVFFRVTSALFNPAITFGMVVEGSLGWKRGVCVAISQFLGGMTAAGLVSGLFPEPLEAETVLGSGTSIARGFFIEVLLTAAFVFSIFMLATEKHKGSFTSPIGIGLALFIAQLVGGPFTGASLNPARSFGAAVAAHHFPGYHWIYWIGPMLGSLLAVCFYKVVKVLEVETALAVHGDGFLDHHQRGHSHTSNPHVDAAPKEVRVLDPVAENDLEKGLKSPAATSSDGHSVEHPHK